jgi:hypothetical protein
MVGKQVGLLVEMQEPNEQGQVFAAIAGYGPASSVSSTSAQTDDEIPF